MIYAESFVFDDRTAEEFHLQICGFDGNGYQDDLRIGSIEMSKTANPIQNRYPRVGNYRYGDVLTFTFNVGKHNNEYFDAYEIEAIERWLIERSKSEYKVLRFVQEDLCDTFYMASCTSMQCIANGGMVYGLTLTFTCDAPFGYSHSVEVSFAPSAGNTTVSVYDNSSVIGYQYLSGTITVRANGNISIVNSLEPSRVFTLNNCVAGEVITIDGKNQQITTNRSAHTSLWTDCSFLFPRVLNTPTTRWNTLTPINCNISLHYNPIRR